MYPIPKKIDFYAPSKSLLFEQNSQQLNSGTINVFSIPPKVPGKGRLVAYENCLIYQHPDTALPSCSPPERECFDITGFSQKSRKRLFDKFNKIRYSEYGIPLFLSLTYHYDDPTNQISLKLQLRNFLKRLFRLLPDHHYIWKLEYQDRGVPHFHIIIFPLDKSADFFTPEIIKSINDHWLSVKTCKCKSCTKYAVKTVKVDTLTMALSYISKEIAKVQDRYESHDLGRIWGTSRELKTDPIDQIDITPYEYESFIDIAVSEVENKINNLSDDKLFLKDKLLLNRDYLLGLKYIPNNSIIYVPMDKYISLLLRYKQQPEKKTINKKLILKKYNWKG